MRLAFVCCGVNSSCPFVTGDIWHMNWSFVLGCDKKCFTVGISVLCIPHQQHILCMMCVSLGKEQTNSSHKSTDILMSALF